MCYWTSPGLKIGPGCRYQGISFVQNRNKCDRPNQHLNTILNWLEPSIRAYAKNPVFYNYDPGPLHSGCKRSAFHGWWIAITLIRIYHTTTIILFMLSHSVQELPFWQLKHFRYNNDDTSRMIAPNPLNSFQSWWLYKIDYPGILK